MAHWLFKNFIKFLINLFYPTLYIGKNMHSVKLILTDAQLKKMKSSNPFQLSHRQLSGNSKGKHEIMLNLPETE